MQMRVHMVQTYYRFGETNCDILLLEVIKFGKYGMFASIILCRYVQNNFQVILI